MPESFSVTFDANLAADVGEIRPDYQFGTDTAGSQFRPGEIQIVTLLETMIGKFISCHHANTVRCTIIRNDIDAREFSFFATIFCVTWNVERIKWIADN